jgi:hypothetical protein
MTEPHKFFRLAIFVLLPILVGVVHYTVHIVVFDTSPDALDQIGGALSISRGLGYFSPTGHAVTNWPLSMRSYSLPFFKRLRLIRQ